MTDAYLAIIGRDAAATAAAIAPMLPMLTQRVDRPNFSLLAAPSMPVMEIGGGALLIGRAYQGSARATSEALERAFADPDRRRLFEICWGDFLLLSGSEPSDDVDLLRSPSAQLHAYRVNRGVHWFVASDLDLLLDANLVAIRLDDTFVAHHLAFPHLRGGRTGLAGVDEPFAGDCTTMVGDRTRRSCVWSPWSFALGPQLSDAREIEASLRASVVLAVTALTRDVPSPLLELSGGLDSSIVAAAMKIAGKEVIAINLVAPAAEGDERIYARMVAERFGFALIERFPDEAVNLLQAPGVRSPRPGMPGVLRAWEEHFIAVGRDTAATAFISGTGGDNVFCSLASAAPAADRLRQSGLGRAFLRTCRDVAVIHGASIAAAAWMAIRQACRPPPRPVWPRASDFLNRDALPAAPLFHPWLEEPRRALPGKRVHIRSIMAAMAHLDGYGRHCVAPSIFPLLAQPVIEQCLRIPTWLWVAGGRDRAAARHAFSHDLPPAIVARQTKGRINSYAAASFRLNRERLGSLLLEGYLSSLGLLDRPRIEMYLQNEGPVTDDQFYFLLPIIDTEIWARAWRA
ncbi:asparagine synthetase B family protein [Sphingomonas koreensis]|nr:asparagine synthetase B family protein [Sphingomonas koreensis]